MAEVALEAALKGERPVLLGVASPRSVIAGLVLKRSGVSLATIFEGRLADDDFERLAGILREVNAPD
jgi:hypothetical protein